MIILLIVGKAHAQTTPADSLTRIQFVKLQATKGDSLEQEALNIAKPGATNQQLNQAISNIMEGLHIYSKYRDTVGLVQSFDNLGMVYHLQKKYAQAKWYTLQSNTLSRYKRDTANIINSLINLATVKQDIKDYALAEQDLNEAAYLAKLIAKPTLRLSALQTLAGVYTKSGDTKKAAMVLNNIAHLKDSVKVRKTIAATKPNVAGQTQVQPRQNIIQKGAVKLRQIVDVSSDLVKISILIISFLCSMYFILYLSKKREEKK